ncbi:MAG TPA: hypothetical protein VNM67_26110 [Thermoanaerobaculia bacterium]|jgi:hypothetical protein|nr:hypothetical protein [Thermoanaerobaculia bacterium]
MTSTWKTLQLALAIALTAASAPAAQLRPSSDLLLPWFEVDLEPSGMTTLFAVGNASEKPVEVLATLRTNWGIAILDVPFTLQPDEIRTVNLRDWLRAESLAAASGQPSPKDRMYYGSAVPSGRAVGSVTLRTRGGLRDALWGDWFVVDAGGGAARGEALVDIDRSGAHSALCRSHLLRYLNGGSFAGETEVIVWRDTGDTGDPDNTAGQPSAGADGTSTGGVRMTAEASVLSETGRQVESRQIELLALDRITVGDLGLEESFGALRIETADDVFIGLRHSAENRYSVALQAYCVAGSCESKKTALGMDILLDGENAGGPRGPLVDSGSQLDWAFLISNRGQLPVSGIEVQGIDASCPAGELAAGETMVCTATGTALSSPQTVAVEVTGRSSCAEVSARGTGYYEGVLVDVFP